MTPSPQITAKARYWAIGWSLVILLISCIPYVIAALSAPEGWQFTGILVNPLDGHTYLAKMQQGVAGEWLFHLSYSPEPHDGAFIHTFYLALGHLVALTGLSKILIFHLARLLAGFGLLFMVFRFIRRVTPDPAEQRLAFIFILTASGLGWLGAGFGAFPIDLWIPEALVPYSLYTNPHFPLAMMLMLIILDQVLSSTFHVSDLGVTNSSQAEIQNQEPRTLSPKPNTQNLKPILWAGLAALILAMVLPFALFTVWATLGVFLSWLFVRRRCLPWQQIWPTLGVVIFAAPVIFYQYWVSVTNPVLAGWSAQNITPAPKLLDFWLGYGLVGLLAVVGAILIIRSWGGDRDKSGREAVEFSQTPADSTQFDSVAGEWLVLLWAVTTVVLVYIPFDLQRRLITGLHIPLCILAAIGLRRWLVNSRLKSSSQLITMAVVAMGALGTLVVWGIWLFGALQSPTESVKTALLFVRQEELAAFEWLGQHAESDDVILASPRLGLFVPGHTGARAFYGHPFETVEASRKEAQTEAFYRGDIKAVTPPADYIIYGPSEQSLGQPEILSDYPIVFSAGDLLVYKVSN